MVSVAPALIEELRRKAEHDGIERLVVGAVVVRKGPEGLGQVLVLDRPATDFWGGIEELPSGQVEAGEPLLEALERELEEEAGLQPRRVGAHLFLFDYVSGSGKQSRQLNFLVLSDGAPVRTSAEHSGYRWLSLPELAASHVTANIVEARTASWSELERAVAA